MLDRTYNPVSPWLARKHFVFDRERKSNQDHWLRPGARVRPVDKASSAVWHARVRGARGREFRGHNFCNGHVVGRCYCLCAVSRTKTSRVMNETFCVASLSSRLVKIWWIFHCKYLFPSPRSLKGCLAFHRSPESATLRRWETWRLENTISTTKPSTTSLPSALISLPSCWWKITASDWRPKTRWDTNGWRENLSTSPPMRSRQHRRCRSNLFTWKKYERWFNFAISCLFVRYDTRTTLQTNAACSSKREKFSF